MNIKLTYEPNAKELARASALFIEKKPFMLYTIGFINIFSWLILLILVLKLFVIKSILPNEALAGIGACLWIFARRSFSQWLLYTRMKNSFLLNASLTIEISLNGLAWSGQRIRSESLKWQDVKFALETKNGFILPSANTQFLWLPFRGFSSTAEVDAFREMLIDKKIVLRKYLNWEC